MLDIVECLISYSSNDLIYPIMSPKITILNMGAINIYKSSPKDPKGK